MPDVEIGSAAPAELATAEVLALYDSVGWSAYTGEPQVLLAGLAGSSHVVAARIDGRLVGLARVISDGATLAYLQDLLVSPDVQGRGIGRGLVQAAFAPYASVRQKVLLTDDVPATRGFYERLGWQSTDELGLRCFLGPTR